MTFLQAIEWLKAYLSAAPTPTATASSPASSSSPPAANSYELVHLHDKRFAHTLELAMRFGKVLLVSDVDRIEPLLYPLLRRDLERQGPRQVVQIGDKLVDYDPNFRLFLLTREADPHLPQDAKPLLTLANFTVTRSGLEGKPCTCVCTMHKCDI